VVPIRSNIPLELAGFLVAGISAHLKLDELYRSFLDLVATQIATAIANARAYEEERKRAGFFILSQSGEGRSGRAIAHLSFMGPPLRGRIGR
jgi:GAF domain-containing protein